MAKVVSLRSPEDFSILNESHCAFGVFDGVHAGHQYLIEQAYQAAQSSANASATRPALSVVLTFDKDPDELFCPQALMKLMSNGQRVETLSRLKTDVVAVIPFTKEFASLAPNDFLNWAFLDNTPSSLHVGSNFRFGCKAQGDTHVLCAWGEAHDMEVVVHDLLKKNGAPISSTRIRSLMIEGKDEQARELFLL